mmetsp:Transcript_342/g.998  ORF Transcript_342/g.998 Transcript_342/m.998 type:complete len:99 (+) Transcript_342:191-487(+)
MRRPRPDDPRAVVDEAALLFEIRTSTAAFPAELLSLRELEASVPFAEVAALTSDLFASTGAGDAVLLLDFDAVLDALPDAAVRRRAPGFLANSAAYSG